MFDCGDSKEVLEKIKDCCSRKLLKWILVMNDEVNKQKTNNKTEQKIARKRMSLNVKLLRR